MKLKYVIYRLFASDAFSLGDMETTSVHEIDREVELIFEDDNPLYISWHNKPSQYSDGRWYADVLNISASKPVLP